MSVIVGLNAFHPGSSAALLIDGTPVAAIPEERLNRVKYYSKFPKLAVNKCLEMGGVTWRDVDAVAVGRDTSANLSQKLAFALRNPTRLLNLLKMKAKASQFDDLFSMIACECGVDRAQLRFKQYNVEHHLAHTASSYFVSSWSRAAGITIDGSGDFVTCMMSECEGDEIRVKKRIFVPHSLGSFYTTICQFIGYDKYGDEGKVMGLAPLGSDTYGDLLKKMVVLDAEGLELAPDYFMPFGEHQGLRIQENGEMQLDRHYSDLLVSKLGAPRARHAEITQRDQDLAFGLQKVFEEAYMHLLNMLHRLVPSERVVISGGCALNSVANGKLFDATPFTETCIQPAAGDEGLALGAALHVSNALLKEGRRWTMRDSYLGPEYSESEIRADLDARGVRYERMERQPLLDATSKEISEGNVVGWFQGRMEWGPRALGNRSILAHPGHPNMKDILNSRIKHREWFRPFAPSVLVERQGDIFDKTHPSPFMLHVYLIKPEWRERLSAVNHVDNTGRLQTVSRDENPLYYDLIRAFERRTSIPVLLNTSFNENEPIVCQPSEAIDCYLRTKMDVLAIGPFFCRKASASA
jgi:carbamoyltransferase